MKTPAIDIKDILCNDSALHFTIGLDLVFATNVFVSSMPEDPNSCMCIYDTGGFDPLVTETYEQPTVMIHFRAKKYETAYGYLEGICQYLHMKYNETVNQSVIRGIWQIGAIAPVERDDRSRVKLSANFRIQRVPT
jgi:hypothetical protein